MKTKTIYTRWMAYELRKLGHNPVTIQPNPHKPNFDVWVFQDTNSLEEDMTKITKDAKNKKNNKEKNKDERREENS